MRALWSNAQDGGAWAEALLSPLFGEFLRSVPESNVIYSHKQVHSDDDQHHILTKFKKKCRKEKLSRHSIERTGSKAVICLCSLTIYAEEFKTCT